MRRSSRSRSPRWGSGLADAPGVRSSSDGRLCEIPPRQVRLDGVTAREREEASYDDVAVARLDFDSVATPSQPGCSDQGGSATEERVEDLVVDREMDDQEFDLSVLDGEESDFDALGDEEK